jgi:hypothetical protein
MDACQIQRQMLGRSFPEIDDALLRLIPALEKRGDKELAKRCRQVVDDQAAPETP